MRRYDAAAWLRKMIGVVGARDLPAEPSEEEFRLGLRSGLILCNVLNKIQPGAVPKVVESLCDSTQVADGAALSAYQYFENVRNFFVSVQDMSLPTFEASDLEQLVESVLTKVMEEFEHRIVNQAEVKKTSSKDTIFLYGNKILQKQNSSDTKPKIKDRNAAQLKKEQCFSNNYVSDEESKRRSMKQVMIIDGQHRDIKELKQTLSTTKAGMQFMQLKFHEEMQNLGLHIHGLAHAASGYHKVFLENRKLYNQVQDLKGLFKDAIEDMAAKSL